LFESAKKSRQYAHEYMSKLGYTKPTASISHLVDGNGKSYLISSDETHLTPMSLAEIMSVLCQVAKGKYLEN